MAAPTYLTRDQSINQTRVVDAIQIGVGIPSAGQVVATSSNGLIDPSLLPASSASGSSFIYSFPLPQTNINIKHNLGRFPSVTVVDSAGELCVGSVTYIDNNNINLQFSAPFAGAAYLN